MNSRFFIILLFCLGFSFGPLWQLNFLTNMPGDIVDARLNNYFLENIYKFLNGQAASLFHLEFFYPYPFVGGFSDNLFGASPVYIMARYVGLDPEMAFQIWYLIGFLVNFIAAYIALKIFDQSHAASALGAFLFTFGLPVTAQMGHPQLQYRFAIPFAIVYFYQFITAYKWQALIGSLFWLYWQFLCSIYLGFFTALYLIMMIFSVVFHEIFWLRRLALTSFLKQIYNHYCESFILLSIRYKVFFFVYVTLIGLAFYSLFYPYLKVTSLYHFGRQWVEVSAMLPRLGSYFLADHSQFWTSVSHKITGIPIRWEQQLFIGVLPTLIILLVIFLENKLYFTVRKNFCILFSFFVLVIITLNYNNYSIWYFLHVLPLFSAIRAVCRIELLFLFPISYFFTISVDYLLKKNFLPRNYLLLVVSSLLIVESCGVTALTSPKLDWHERFIAKKKQLPESLPEDTILFFSQNSRFFEQEELDAMLVAQKRNLPTLNGYSGAVPHHFHAIFGDDCAEYPRRIILYLDFIGMTQNKETYRQLARRVLPVNFVGCDEGWKLRPPMTVGHRALTQEEISQLSLELSPKSSMAPPGYLKIRIVNHGETNIPALSGVDQNLRLAWRLLRADGKPTEAWVEPRVSMPTESLPQGYRRDLSGDIAAHDYIDLLVPIPNKFLNEFAALEFSIIQEATLWGFSLNVQTNIWGHEVGVAPLRVDLPAH